MVSFTWSLSSVLAVLRYNWSEGPFWDSTVLCPFGPLGFIPKSRGLLYRKSCSRYAQANPTLFFRKLPQ
jgi:hypothetical protein